MNQSTNLNEVRDSNILVREEVKKDSPIYNITNLNKVQPGETTPLRSMITSNIVPILKALVIITLFLLDGVGFSPLGCKTQFLMSSRFWYNKQIVIFFIIYFIINLGGDTISKLTDPFQQLIISVSCLLFYNVVARVGTVWWDKNPWYWPGAMTYFGLVCLPLVLIVILDDMRRYYMAENALYLNANIIDKIRKVEFGIVIVTLVLIAMGFIKATFKSYAEHGKYFSFLAFFFGVPMGNKRTGKIVKCGQEMFKKFRREINLPRAKPYTSNTDVIGKILIGLVLAATGLTIGYFTLYKNFVVKVLKNYNKKIPIM